MKKKLSTPQIGSASQIKNHKERLFFHIFKKTSYHQEHRMVGPNIQMNIVIVALQSSVIEK